MIALFVILDLLIFALLVVAVLFLVHKIVEVREKDHPAIENDLEEFRNDALYEESREEMKKLAHIEEVAANGPPVGEGEESDV